MGVFLFLYQLSQYFYVLRKPKGDINPQKAVPGHPKSDIYLQKRNFANFRLLNGSLLSLYQQRIGKLVKSLGNNFRIFQLVEKCQGNDPDGFSEIIAMFQPLIKKYAYLLNYMDAYTDMYDCLIDCIYKIPLKDLCHAAGDAAVLAYIKTTMRNSYIALSKRNGIRKSQPSLDDSDTGSINTDCIYIDFDKETIKEDLLRFLSPEDELLLEAKVFYGYSDAEIAKKTWSQQAGCQ